MKTSLKKYQIVSSKQRFPHKWLVQPHECKSFFFWKASLYAEVEFVSLNMKFIGNQMITGPGGQREKYELKGKNSSTCYI